MLVDLRYEQPMRGREGDGGFCIIPPKDGNYYICKYLSKVNREKVYLR